VVLPVAGIVLFFFPLYYQFYKAPPTYPVKIANWVAVVWTVVGILLTIWVATSRRERLRDMERVYVEDDDPTAGETTPAVGVA
jgi:Na+/melibiose symporter-like transporter